MSSIVLILLGKVELVDIFFCLWLAYRLFAHPADVIGRLCSVTVALSGHRLYCVRLTVY